MRKGPVAEEKEGGRGATREQVLSNLLSSKRHIQQSFKVLDWPLFRNPLPAGVSEGAILRLIIQSGGFMTAHWTIGFSAAVAVSPLPCMSPAKKGDSNPEEMNHR